MIPPPPGASGIDKRTLIAVMAIPVWFTHETESPVLVSAT